MFIVLINYREAPELFSCEKYPALRQNWNYSYNKLQSLNKILTDKLDNPEISVVVAGSFGRMDACQDSDLDYMILTETNTNNNDIKTIIEKAAKKLRIKIPNPTGVFSEVIPVTDMIDKIGSRDDTLSIVSQRMLLLMETQPVYNEAVFKNTLDRILKKYLHMVMEDPSKEALFLINDIIRYFRSICVNYEFNFWKEEDKWVIRNVKLRHSRIVMYAGLLLLVLNASKHNTSNDNKYSYILSKLMLTPMERIVHVYNDNTDHSIGRILSTYDTFLRKISDSKIRKMLQISYEERYQNPQYCDLKVTSEFLQTELTRFIVTNRNFWTAKVFEYMFF